MKKAQASVETLMIYGITIFIVMLAIAALVGFGVLDLGRLLPDRCEITNALSCENYAVSTTQVQLELTNTMGKNIDGFIIDIEGEGNDEGIWNCVPVEYGCVDLNDDGDCTDLEDVGCFDTDDSGSCQLPTEQNSESVVVNGDTTDVVTLTCDIQVPSGKKINGIIDITVYPVGSQIGQPVTGSIRATVA